MRNLEKVLRRRAAAVSICAAGALLAAPAIAGAQTPFNSDPVGPISNVSANCQVQSGTPCPPGTWQYYQPSSDFCVPDQVFEYPSDTQDTETGEDPACAASGYPTTATGLYEVQIDTPPLCATCVRLFINYADIEPNSLGMYSQGHAYIRLSSANPTYYSWPTSHSPNIKNFTNDYFVAPPGSTQSEVASNTDPHLLAYAADTAHYAHTTEQGPYYVGPGYVNQYGDWINGAYIDVDLSQSQELGQAQLDDIYYAAGYNTDPSACPDTLANPAYNDGNYFYGGCVNAGGMSSSGVGPWPDGN